MNYKKYKMQLIVAAASLITVSISAQKKAQIWKDYVKDKKSGNKPALIDYSYAGYAYGEKEIPDVSTLNYPVFDITKYGAVANDTLADDKAIHAAIRDAEKAGKGIVFLPKGRYVVNKGKNFSGFEINHSNIIVKGEGAGPGGTEVFMQDRNNFV